MKSNRTLTLLLVIATSFLAPSDAEEDTIICIYQKEKENLCSECTRNGTDFLNKALSGKNVTIRFCSDVVALESVISIVKSHRVKITGMPSQLKCKEQFKTGLHLSEITDLVVENVELVSCGKIYNVSKNVSFISSIYVVNCTDVAIENLNVTGSQGNGLTMFDNNGMVTIANSIFEANQDCQLFDPSLRPAGSGLHIILSYCGPRNINENNMLCMTGHGRDIMKSNYTIEHCNFTGNRAGHNGVNSPFSEEPQLLASGFGRGGGLSLILDRNSMENSIRIRHCEFVDNSALWGGGLYVTVAGNSQNNTIRVEDSLFQNNSCSKLSGGGANIGFQSYQGFDPQNNRVTLDGCRFEGNGAVFGGGTSFYASPSTKHNVNEMIFTNCTWCKNTASIGAAVNIAPQVWEIFTYDLQTNITFRDCKFLHNRDTVEDKGDSTSYQQGKGAFSTAGYKIRLAGTNTFHDNANSALYLTSTEVELCEDSSTLFTENQGINGGAIYMLGFSALLVHDNVEVTFTNNSATTIGSAIFQQTYDPRDFFASQSCFIKYIGDNPSVAERNVNFLFSGNTVGQGSKGNSVHSTTIEPCYNSNHCKENWYNQTFDCIGNFTFNDELQHEISTSGAKITFDRELIESPNIMWVIPGKLTKLPVKTFKRYV